MALPSTWTSLLQTFRALMSGLLPIWSMKAGAILLALALVVAAAIGGARLTGNVPSPVSLHDLEVMTDRDGAASIADVVSGAASALFRPAGQPVPHFGTGGGVHWLRFTLRHDGTNNEDAVLAVRFPYLQDVTLVQPRVDGSPALSRAGSHVPMSAESLPVHVPAFAVSVPPDKGLTLFLRLRSDTVVMAPLDVLSPATFWPGIAADHLIFGTMIGVLVACAFYVGTFYVALREESYLAFALLALLAAFYVLSASGLGKLWLWPGVAGLSGPLYLVVQGALFSTAAWFFQAFLRTAESSPNSHVALNLLKFCGAASMLSPLLPAPVTTLLYLVVALFGPLIMFAIIVSLWRDGHPHARVAAIGWGMTLAVTVYLYLRVFDITPYLWINSYLAPAGFAFAVVYFAWALAWRLRESEHLSLHDPMTGLGNRRYLDAVLARHTRRCVNRRDGIGVLHLDLDGFKQINDTLGHDAGDRVLIRISRLLRANVRKQDFVARIGGDEFVVICPYHGDRGALAAVADRLARAINQPFQHEGHPCRIGASIGIAHAQGSQVDGHRLIADADIALYAAKSLGRNRFEFYSPSQSVLFEARRRTADEILQALANREFTCLYQPIVDGRSLAVIGIEALVRWDHPVRGLLTPAAFMQQADDLGVTAEIDRFVLERAVADMATLDTSAHGSLILSVNVSTRRLHDPHLLQSVADLNTAHCRLAFELLETTFLDKLDGVAAKNIAALKEAGISLDIDDFGSGHASILSLIEVGPRRLKIDRGIVATLGPDAAQQRLICAIMEIGRSLDIAIVAEGVETAEQAKILRDLGCDGLQGRYFADVMSITDLRSFLGRRALRRVS